MNDKHFPASALPAIWPDPFGVDIPTMDLPGPDSAIPDVWQNLGEEDLAFLNEASVKPTIPAQMPNYAENLPVAELPVLKQSSTRRLKAPEWEKMRPFIETHYIDEGKPFEEVAQAMEAEFNYKPT